MEARYCVGNRGIVARGDVERRGRVETGRVYRPLGSAGMIIVDRHVRDDVFGGLDGPSVQERIMEGAG